MASGRPTLPGRAVRTAALTARAPWEARFAFRSPAVVERAQRRRVRAVVAHAYEHVPYYRETMRRLGLGPGDIVVAGDLAKLPLIEREQLQRDPDYFLSRAHPREELLELRTGGSTGEPVLFWRDPGSLFQRLLGFQRMEPVLAHLSGKRLRRRHALIRPPESSTREVNVAVQRRVLPSVRTVHAGFSLFAPPSELAAAVERFEPDVVTGYGSAIEVLFAEILARERPGHLPRVVVYAADPLSEPMRREISALGVHVLSVYQAVETPTIGFECEAHAGHHLNADLCPLRILAEDGREQPPGEPGQVVASNLVNRGTVLLNYLLGDVATLLADRCPCGRSLPLLSAVEGRVTDLLRSATGEAVHPQAFRSVLREVPGIRRYQLVQDRPGLVRVVALTAPGADLAEIRRQVMAGTAWLRDGLEVEVAFAEELPRTAAGKVRSLVP